MQLAWARYALRCGLVAFLPAGAYVPAAFGAVPEPSTIESNIAAAEFALADHLREMALAQGLRVAEAAAVAAAWQFDRARARLRLEDRREAAAIEVNLRRRELAAGFIRLGPIAEGDGRARVLLAGLAHAAAAATARMDRLSADRAPLAREQRVANSAMAIWRKRNQASLAAQSSAGERWFRALRYFAAHVSGRHENPAPPRRPLL